MIRTLKILCFLCGSMTITAQSHYYGKVIDQDSQAVVGAYVSLDRLMAVTDDQGHFSLTSIEAGPYELKIHGIGYDSLSRKISLDESQYLGAFVIREKIYAFAPIEISGSWIASDQPFTFANLGRQEIENRNVGQDVPFILRAMPSTVVTSDAGTGIGYTGIRIRGSDPSRINVTIDGIPVNDAESQGVFWVDLPDLAGSAEEIQVQRGVGTSTQGAGAFGGTINVKSQRFRSKAHAILDATLGSFGTKKSSLRFGSGLISDRFTVEGRVSKITSDGYIDRGAADLTSLYLAGTYLDDKQSLKVKLIDGRERTYQAWNGVPAQYIDDPVLRTYNSAGKRADGSFHPDEVDDYKQTHLHTIYNREFGRSVVGQLGLHYTHGEGFFEQYRVEDPLQDYQLADVIVEDAVISSSDLIRRRWLDNDFYGFVFSLSSEQQGRGPVDWSLGGGYNTYLGRHFGEVTWARTFGSAEQGHEYYRNDAKKQDANVYGQVEYRFSPATQIFTDLQWRYVDYRFEGFDQNLEIADQQVDMLFFNPKVGLVIFDQQKQWYYSLGIAHREPNRDDYVQSSPSSRPRPEVLFDHEAGVRWQAHRFDGSANLYYMRYRDQLILTGEINDVGEYIRTNVKDSYRAGLELEAAAHLHEKLDVTANATISDNRIDEFEEGIDDWDSGWQVLTTHVRTPIAFSPSTILQASARYRWLKGRKSKLESEWLQKYIGKQYLDNTGSDHSRLDPYHLSDLQIRYHVTPSWCREVLLGLSLQNVFDLDIVSNGWIYRFKSEGYDPRSDDAHARKEHGNLYNLTGYYPQAGRNILVNLKIGF